jgi:hypothetical protein
MWWGGGIYRKHMIKKEQFWIHWSQREVPLTAKIRLSRRCAISPLYRSFEEPFSEDSSEFDQSGSFPQLLKATIVEPHDSQKARLKFETLQTLSSIVAETYAAYPSKFGISHDMQQRGGNDPVMSQRIGRSSKLEYRYYLGLIINERGSRDKYINILLRFTSCLNIVRFRKQEIYSDIPNDENIHLTTFDRVCSIR